MKYVTFDKENKIDYSTLHIQSNSIDILPSLASRNTSFLAEYFKQLYQVVLHTYPWISRKSHTPWIWTKYQLIIQLLKSIIMDCFLYLELQCCFNEHLQIQTLINFFYRFRFINLTTTITLQLGYGYIRRFTADGHTRPLICGCQYLNQWCMMSCCILCVVLLYVRLIAVPCNNGYSKVTYQNIQKHLPLICLFIQL